MRGEWERTDLHHPTLTLLRRIYWVVSAREPSFEELDAQVRMASLERAQAVVVDLLCELGRGTLRLQDEEIDFAYSRYPGNGHHEREVEREEVREVGIARPQEARARADADRAHGRVREAEREHRVLDVLTERCARGRPHALHRRAERHAVDHRDRAVEAVAALAEVRVVGAAAVGTVVGDPRIAWDRIPLLVVTEMGYALVLAAAIVPAVAWLWRLIDPPKSSYEPVRA